MSVALTNVVYDTEGDVVKETIKNQFGFDVIVGVCEDTYSFGFARKDIHSRERQVQVMNAIKKCGYKICDSFHGLSDGNVYVIAENV